MSQLEQFYDILAECGLDVPNRELWLAYYTDNTEFWPLTNKAGQLMGGILFKGHTIHVAVKPEVQGRWINKTMLKAYREWKHPVDLIAHPACENVRAIELCKRLGFTHRGCERGHEIFVKEATCQPSS